MFVGNTDSISSTQDIFTRITAAIVASVARFADLVVRALQVGKAPVNWFAVSSDAPELVRTVTVGPADFSASSILTNLITSTFPVGLAIYSAQSLVAEFSNGTSVVT